MKRRAGAMACRRIGLLGGSFNPAHEGHRHLSLFALRALGLNEIWWLVSPQNPLKSRDGMQAYDTRLAQAAVTAQHPKIRVLDLERALGTRYTFDTVHRLQRRHPATRFVWLMGADNLAQFHRWRRWRALAGRIPFAVFDRAPFSHRALRAVAPQALARWRIRCEKSQRLWELAPPAWGFFHMRRHAASATLIRKLLGREGFLAHTKDTI